jgi:hypothetical protein
VEGCLERIGEDDLDAIVLKINTRPRKTLRYRTPAATLAERPHGGEQRRVPGCAVPPPLTPGVKDVGPTTCDLGFIA